MTDQVPLPPTGQKNLEAFQALLEIDEKERTFKERQGFLTAYLFSFLLPPLGVYFFIKYVFFSNRTPEEIRAGIISLAVAVVSSLISLWFVGLMFGSGSLQGIDKNMDILKQFVTPANQKQFRDLMQ